MLNKQQNIALVIEYDGTNYSGFQRQIGQSTIQDKLEEAITKFTNSNINIIPAGRTDRGVHALYQVINFKTEAIRSMHSWFEGLNSLLPDDIAVKDVKIVDDAFNARFAAVSRTYHYYLYLTANKPAILNSKVGICLDKLAINLMQQAINKIEGQHDFSSFRAANCQAKNPVKIMHQAKISLKENYLHGQLLRFEFKANSFLYHMIRNIVGALVYVGNGKISIEQFEQILEQKDRKIAPPTFMADGLYLVDVDYNSDVFIPAYQDWLF
jgi:tRNA pseudouridine38-40 synthase